MKLVHVLIKDFVNRHKLGEPVVESHSTGVLQVPISLTLLKSPCTYMCHDNTFIINCILAFRLISAAHVMSLSNFHANIKGDNDGLAVLFVYYNFRVPTCSCAHPAKFSGAEAESGSQQSVQNSDEKRYCQTIIVTLYELLK